MKAITLYQPWASLVAQGTKVYETRAWPPPASLIDQRIAIHAGKSQIGCTFALAWGLDWMELPFGAVVCTAHLVAAHCIRMADRERDTPADRAEVALASLNPEADPLYRAPVPQSLMDGDVRYTAGTIPTDEYGDYAPGRWAWRLVDVELLDPPVPARGCQGLWNWEPAS